MSRRAWWLGAGLVVLLPAAAAGVGAVMLDPNDYKADIVRAVQAKTGRLLGLNGPLRVSRSLWPTIEANDVTLANLPGGTRRDMARAERIEAQLSLPALFSRRIEVIKLTLVGPDILFEEAGGKPNWTFTAQPGEGDDARAAASGPPFSLRIRSAHVQDGMVTTRLPARTRVVGIRALDLDQPADGGPLNLASVLVYSDNQPFSLRASAQPTAGVFDPWTTQLEFAAFDAAASARGTMDLAGTYELQVEAKAGALERLNALLPEMRLPALHGMVLSTHLTNGPVLGELPVPGATRLQFDGADLGDRVPGLRLGAASLSMPEAGALVTVAAAGNYAGQGFTLGGTVGMPMHLDRRTTLPLDLKAQAVPGKGKAALTAEASLALQGKLTLNALRFGGLDAAAALEAPALAALRPMLAQTPAAHALPALTDVRFEGRLIVPADAGSVGFKGAKLQTHAGDVAGDGTVGLGAGPALHAKLRSTRLDLDAALKAFGLGPLAKPTPADAAGPLIPDAPLPWHLLRGPALDLSAAIGSLTWHGQAWQKLDVALNIEGGRMRAGSLKLALPGGALEASMTADAASDDVPVSLAVHAPGFPLALVARAAGLPGPVSGTVRLDADLHASGRSAAGLAASLEGPFSATATGGQMSNAAFIKLASASLDPLGIKVPAQGATAIRCLGLAGSFSRGVGRFRTIALDTTYLQLNGAGQVDLGQETVAFKLHPLAHVSGSTVSVPVLVEGPFRAIQGRLDADGLDKLGLLIDAWFGGDHPDTCSDAGLAPGRARGR